ncbi:MAG: hypothetical protein ACYDAL_14115 [Candidatus Dormibacteraceae bacterium]
MAKPKLGPSARVAGQVQRTLYPDLSQSQLAVPQATNVEQTKSAAQIAEIRAQAVAAAAEIGIEGSLPQRTSFDVQATGGGAGTIGASEDLAASLGPRLRETAGPRISTGLTTKS